MPSNGPDPGGPKPPASPAPPPKDMAEVIARYDGGDLIAAVALVECLCAKLQDARDEIERLKRATPGPATEEMKAAYGAGYRRGFAAGQQSHQTSLPSEWVDAGWNVWCIARDRGREHGRPVPDADPLASMRADLKVKKTPDVDE